MSTRLRLLGGTPADNTNTDFVLINGLGRDAVDEWAIASTQWHRILSKADSRPRLYAFDHGIVLEDELSIDSFLEAGQRLLMSLAQHQDDQEHMRPYLFMCHSLGCLILKHAMCIANAQNQRYSTVLNSTLGIVFLGAPNVTPDETTLSKVICILSSVTSNITSQSMARIKTELNCLVKVCSLFQAIQLRIEILSLYETKPTKVRIGRKKSLFKTYREEILVDKTTAKSGAPRERTWSLEGDHFELCKLQQHNGTPDAELERWLMFALSKSSLEAARNRLRAAQVADSPTVSLTSISSLDAARIALTRDASTLTASVSRSRSVEATVGHSSGAISWEIVPILENFAAPRKFARLPCFMMETPVQNKDFCGRESILQYLDDCLIESIPNPDQASAASDLGTQRHVVLCGMGGLGKTSIAIEYAFSRRDKFDAMFWIRADDPSKLEQDFTKMASQLGLEDPNEQTNPVISRQLAMGWLADPKKIVDVEGDIMNPTDANWLIIFDNADAPDILQDYWPISSNGSILVTSRDPLSKASPSVATHCIDLKPLSETEALNMLQKLSGITGRNDDGVKIVQKLGCLPLAISQMAAVIKYEYLSYSDFLERYEDDSDRKDLHSIEVGVRRQEARGNIASIWAIEKLEPGPKALLDVFSVLDPDCIPEQMLFSNSLEDEALAGFPRRRASYDAARAQLMKRSLVTRNEVKKELWIHRVLQSSVWMELTNEHKLAVFSFAVRLVANAWGDTPLEKRHDMSMRRSRGVLFPHTLSLMTVYERYYKEENPAVSIQLARLLNESGWYQHERGYSLESKPFWRLALTICQRNEGTGSAQLLADIHYGLAAAANETNAADECLHHTQILLDKRLRIFEERQKPDLRLAVAHNELGIAWVMNGVPSKAISHFKSSIKSYKALCDYWNPMDTNPRTNLAFTYWLIGELDIASTTFQELLCDREDKWGPDDTESYRTGRVYHGLGNVRYDQGSLDESENWHQRALAQYQRTIGNAHHKTADLCHRVAQHCMRRGEFKNAITLIDQALKTWQLRASTFVPEIARTTFLKAKVVMHSGNDLEAASLFKEAITLRDRVPWATYKAASDLREEDFDCLVMFLDR